MANFNRQRLTSEIPGVLQYTSDRIGEAVLQLQGLYQAARAKVELSEPTEDGDTISSTETAEVAIKEAVELLQSVLNIHDQHAEVQIADSILRHGRLRNALLQLLVLTMRWELLNNRTAQPSTAAPATEQLQLASTAEEGNGRDVPECGTVGSCRFYLLAVLSFMLKAGAEQLTRAYSGRGGGGSRAAQGVGRRRVGVASASTLQPGGPSASDGPPLSLLALDLGCALLRMHTLQCCSQQVAAIWAWMGGDCSQQEERQQPSQEKEEEKQQQQQLGRPQEREEQQQRTAEQEQGREEGATENWVLDVRAPLRLVDGLLALAQAAVGVLGTAEGLAPAAGAVAAAATTQRADVRRMSRRFALLLASHLRDSHLLEHCARAALMAAVGGRVWGAAGGSSARGEVAEGRGQASQRRPSDADSDMLHVLLRDSMWSVSEARDLVKLCMQAPAPASTVIGPAVLQAVTGPAVAHLDLVLGLHALCTADGGPAYGMPVSHRALPAVWEPGRAIDGHWELFTADFHVMGLVNALRRPELRERLYELLGGVGPVLTLQLRVCELTTRSAEVHGQGAEEERGGEEGVRGAAGGTLRYAMTPEAAVGIGFDAHLAVQWLLGECWEQQEQQEQQQEQQQERESAAREPCGSGGRQAAGAGGSSQVASQAQDAFATQGPAGWEEGDAARARGEAERAAGRAPAAARAGTSGLAGREGPDATGADAITHPGGTAGAAAVAATAEDASGGDVAAGVRLGEPGGAAGAAAAAAGLAAAFQAAGAFPQASGQMSGPGRGRRRPLSARALWAFEVRWWRSVCRAAEHMVPLRVGPEEAETLPALRRNLVGWLRMEELQLPNPIEGPLPPTPPPRLAAALDGGLLPCLEGILRRAAKDPEGSCSRLVQEVLSSTDPADESDEDWHGLLLLFAYGEEVQSTRVLSALAALLPRPCGGGSGGSGGGDGTSRHKAKGGPNGGEASDLTQCAMNVACALLDTGFGLWGDPDPPEGGSDSGSGGGGSSSPQATRSTPGVPPPGRRRLLHMLAHATRLLLPLLSRLVGSHCGGADHPRPGRATAGTPSAHKRAAARARGFAGAALRPVLHWITGLSLMGQYGSCAGGSGGGGSSDGGGGGDGSSNGGGASRHTRAARQVDQQQQQGEGALGSVHDAALRRFLFEEVQVVEVLGNALHHLPSLEGFTERGPALAASLVYLTGAYPEQVWRRITVAAEGGKGGGSSSSSSARGGGGARKQRGASGAGAGCSSQPESLWPVELVCGLLPEVEANVKGGGANSLLRETVLLVRLLDAWRSAGAGEGQEGGGSGGHSQLRPTFGRVVDMENTSAGLKRALYEVLSAPAAPLVA